MPQFFRLRNEILIADPDPAVRNCELAVLTLASRSAFVTTETEQKLIAAAAIIGLSSRRTGNPRML